MRSSARLIAEAPSRADLPWVARLTPLRVEVEYRAEEPLELPDFTGGMLRGALGRALQRVTCASRPTCGECRAPLTCPYAYLFETRPPPDSRRLRRYPRAPHPLVVEPPEAGARALGPGDPFRLHLALVGRAAALLPFVVHALHEAGRAGFGRGRARARLAAVRQPCGAGAIELFDPETGALLPPEALAPLGPWPEGSAARATLRFCTPTRLVRDGHLLGTPEPRALVAALLRRLSSLHYFHCGGSELPLDFRALLLVAERLRVLRCETPWRSWRRYSGRQGRHVAMGGFVGDLLLEGELEPLADCLRLGQALHVGKGAIFGLGRYEILPAGLEPA